MDAQHIVDRRTFVQGAALGMAAGAAVAGGLARSAQADEVSPALSATDYQNIYEDGVNLMPGRTTACPGPRGPVAPEFCGIAGWIWRPSPSWEGLSFVSIE